MQLSPLLSYPPSPKNDNTTATTQMQLSPLLSYPPSPKNDNTTATHRGPTGTIQPHNILIAKIIEQ
jgi:hypothetical protein